MERQLNRVGRDIGLASVLLLVVGAYVVMYAWLFDRSALLGVVLITAHALVVAVVLWAGVRRARTRSASDPADHGLDDVIPSFVSHRSTHNRGAGRALQPASATACTVTDLAAVRNDRKRTSVPAGQG
ncbi:MAG: hypothetical protein P8N02_18075 [Actinomycetota bacterium]|jgi:hypothetical protein|nr:hypothetical protein [Actinomycetota bacterium]